MELRRWPCSGCYGVEEPIYHPHFRPKQADKPAPTPREVVANREEKVSLDPKDYTVAIQICDTIPGGTYTNGHGDIVVRAVAERTFYFSNKDNDNTVCRWTPPSYYGLPVYAQNIPPSTDIQLKDLPKGGYYVSRDANGILSVLTHGAANNKMYVWIRISPQETDEPGIRYNGCGPGATNSLAEAILIQLDGGPVFYSSTLPPLYEWAAKQIKKGEK